MYIGWSLPSQISQVHRLAELFRCAGINSVLHILRGVEVAGRLLVLAADAALTVVVT
jgi:hypothetical protein